MKVGFERKTLAISTELCMGPRCHGHVGLCMLACEDQTNASCPLWGRPSSISYDQTVVQPLQQNSTESREKVEADVEGEKKEGGTERQV